MKGTRKKVLMSMEDAAVVLKQYHSSPMGGHSGVNGTLAKVSQNYTWNGMRQDIVDYVRQ